MVLCCSDCSRETSTFLKSLPLEHQGAAIYVFNFIQLGEIKVVPELVLALRQDTLEQEPASMAISTQ